MVVSDESEASLVGVSGIDVSCELKEMKVRIHPDEEIAKPHWLI